MYSCRIGHQKDIAYPDFSQASIELSLSLSYGLYLESYSIYFQSQTPEIATDADKIK